LQMAYVENVVGHYRPCLRLKVHDFWALLLQSIERLDLAFGYRVCLSVWGHRNQLSCSQIINPLDVIIAYIIYIFDLYPHKCASTVTPLPFTFKSYFIYS
jgi:hypothetical protein